jgi:hypothetical protein
MAIIVSLRVYMSLLEDYSLQECDELWIVIRVHGYRYFGADCCIHLPDSPRRATPQVGTSQKKGNFPLLWESQILHFPNYSRVTQRDIFVAMGCFAAHPTAGTTV